MYGPYNTMPRKSDAEVERLGGVQLKVTVDSEKKRMNGWYYVLKDTYENKEVWNIATNEIFFYGSVLFSVASAQLLHDGSTMWKKARNVGAGSAFASDLISGHYHFDIQQNAFRNAMSRAKCGALSIANIAPDDERLALLSTNDIATIDSKLQATDASHPGFIALYNRIPVAASEYIEKTVLDKLQSDLRAASPTKSTLSDLAAAIDKWKKDMKDASAAQSGLLSVSEFKNAANQTKTPSAFNTNKDALPGALKGMNEVQLEIARNALVTSVITFESQLRACDVSN
ncbi:hypothetical protein GCM10027277_51540 [Pseudoduganella ginsengisoli]